MQVGHRAAAIFAALLFVLPTVAILLPGASADSTCPGASAAGAGTEILCDAVGDQGTGIGAGADLVRLGAHTDASTIHFFLQVANANDRTADTSYFISLTSGGISVKCCANPFDSGDGEYLVTFTVTAAGAITNPDVERSASDPNGDNLGYTSVSKPTVTLAGNEYRIDVDRASIGASKDPSALTNIGFTSNDATTGTTIDSQNGSTATYTARTETVATTVPGAPRSLRATTSDAHVSLSWLAPASDGGAAITSYHVYRDGVLVGSPTTTSFSDDGLTNDVAYLYAVKAVNSVGEGAAASVTATPGSVTAPSAPQGPSATASLGKVTLAWSAPASDGGSAVTGYNVYRGLASGAETPLTTTSATGYVDTDVSGNVQYFYLITASNGVGESLAAPEVSATTPPSPDTPYFAVSHAPAGVAPGTLVSPSGSFDPAGQAGEPSIGFVTATNDMAFQAFTSTWWVHRNGPSDFAWSFRTAAQNKINIDPILWTDRSTGRTWAGGLTGNFAGAGVAAGFCSQLAMSDDSGATWTQASVPCDSSQDHETIATGPWHDPTPPNAIYPRAVYYCSQSPTDACTTSFDGGLTWTQPAVITDGCTSLHGHVRVGPDGTAYVPNAHCGANQGMFTTSNNGLTWSSIGVPSAAARQVQDGFDPQLGVTANNTVVFAYNELGTNAMMVALSYDHGATWTTGKNVAPDEHFVAATFPKVATGDNGRIAVAYLATKVGSGDPFGNGFHGVWDAYVSMSYDGGATWVTAKATSDPVQRGCLWAHGGSNACRNLLDFMDVDYDDAGRVVVGFADGCIDACAGPSGTEAQSTTAWSTVAWQVGGKTLFASADNVVSAPAAPNARAYGGAGVVALRWDPPFNGNAGISSYQIYRNDSASALQPFALVGNVAAFDDTSVANGVTYTYAVQAINAIGGGPLSAELSATPGSDTVAPGAVTGLHMTRAQSGEVGLAWNPATDNVLVGHYVVLRDGVQIAAPTGVDFTDSGLQNGRYYAYEVYAVDISGNAGASTAPLSVRPVSVALDYYLGSDPAGDSTGTAAQDILGVRVSDTPSAITFIVSLASSSNLGTETLWEGDFTVANRSYRWEADYLADGTQSNCLVVSEVNGQPSPLGFKGTCTLGNNELRGTFTQSTDSISYAQGDTLSGITVQARSVAGTASSTQTDKAPDTGAWTWVSGTTRQVPPTFTAPTASTVTGAENSALTLAVAATQQTDAVTLSASGLPAGAHFDRATGTLSWTPTYTQSGSYPVTFTADTGASSATKTVTLVIANVDRALQFLAVGDQAGAENTPLAFTLHATDPDGGIVRYSGSGMPSGMQVNSVTGAVSWTPSFTQAGTYHVTYTATDAPSTASQTIAISVANTDRAPTLAPIPSANATEAHLFTAAISMNDADRDVVTLGLTGLPGATITKTGATSGVVSWTPALGDAGTYTYTVTASDGQKLTSVQSTVVVAHFAAFTLTQSAALAHASPGQHVLVTATIANQHPKDDSFSLALAQQLAWTITGPTSVDVPAGESRVVTYDVLVPSDEAFDGVHLDVTSVADATQVKNATWIVDVPVLVKLVLDARFVSAASTQQVTGHVEARHLDGTPAAGASIGVTQTPQNQPALASSLSGSTGASGSWAFSFVVDPRAKTLGIHDIEASGGLPGVAPSTSANSYFVG